MESILKFVLDLAAQNPQVAAVLIVIGGFRVVMKPLMEFAKAIAASTDSLKDDKILSDVESSPIWKGVLFVLDYAFSIKKIK
jgi:Zn finger protein HypA/HybF involved in hydrogenase expression